jgi:NADH-quinone oxidoreductase subunit M
LTTPAINPSNMKPICAMVEKASMRFKLVCAIAAYTLWMFKRVYLGPVTNDEVKGLVDINSREFLMLALLAAATLWMGVYPKPFTDVMNSSVADLLKHVALSKIN